MSEATTVRRVLVWSGALRLVHWLLAAAVLFLLASGAAMVHAIGYREELRFAHVNMGYVLIALLAVRLHLLFFGARTARWEDFIPRGPQWQAAVAVLRFYLSFARGPVPAYFGHNPLWGPVYLVALGALLWQAYTGLAADMGLHRAGHALILVFSGAHILSVFLHDWKGTASEISAMVNGHKIFVVDPAKNTGSGGTPVEVSLDGLLKKKNG